MKLSLNDPKFLKLARGAALTIMLLISAAYVVGGVLILRWAVVAGFCT